MANLTGGRPDAHMPDGREGFAAIDALMALAILAITIALGVGGVSVARRTAQVAAETRAARVQLVALLNGPLRQPGRYSGRSRDFDWIVQVTMAPGATTQRLCRSTAEVRGRTSRRRFDLTIDEICPPVPIEETTPS